MDTQAQNAAISFPSVINLNVGGQIYTTSLATLTKYSESMLGAMFSGRFAAQKDSNGNYFIDRDGALFRYILGFLRNGELQVPENFHEFGLLLKEAEFFQIPALTDAVKQQMQSRDGHKSTDKPEKTEVITVFGDAANGLVTSVSGRLRTLIEMLHCSDRKTERFQVFPYCNQSDRTDSERTGILAAKDGIGYSITVNSVIAIAKMYGFKVTSESHSEPLNLGRRGNKHWILSRPIPKREAYSYPGITDYKK